MMKLLYKAVCRLLISGSLKCRAIGNSNDMSHMRGALLRGSFVAMRIQRSIQLSVCYDLQAVFR